MRRWSKRLAVLTAVVAAMLVLVALAVPKLVPADRLRAQAVAAVEAATGADIEVGRVGVRLLPRLALTLDDGTARGTGADLLAARGQDWGIDRYEARLDRVEARVALLPLLGGRLAVDRIAIAAPRLTVVRDGRTVTAEDVALTLRDLAPGAGTDGAGVPAGTAPGQQLPAGLAVRARLDVGTLTVAGVAWRQVRVEAALKARVVTVSRADADLGGGHVAATGTVDFVTDPWGQLAVEVDAADAPAADLLAGWAQDVADRLDTRLTVHASGTCGLQDAETVRRTLDLAGTCTAGDGVLHAADWLRDVSPYLGGRQDLKDIRFTSLRHAFVVRDGRYRVSSLQLDGPDTAWDLTGSAGLDGTLDLAVQVKLPPGFTPELGAWSFLAETAAGRRRAGAPGPDPEGADRAAQRGPGPGLAEIRGRGPGAESVREGGGGFLDKWKSK